MPQQNPYAGTDILGEFMRGWGAVEEIRGQSEARKDRAEDRRYTRGRRERQVTLEGRTDADYEAEAPIKELERAGRMQTAQRIPLGFERADRDDAQAQADRTQQAPLLAAKTADEIDEANTGGQRRRIAMQADQAQVTGSHLDNQKKRQDASNAAEAQKLALAYANLDDPLVSSLDDEQQQDDITELALSMRNKEPMENAEPRIMSIINKSFASALKDRGKGEKVGKGKDAGTRTGNTQVVGMDTDMAGNVYFTLNNEVARKDGTRYWYKAPATQGKSAREDDPLSRVSSDTLEDILMQSVSTIDEARQAGMTAAQYREATKRALDARHFALTGQRMSAEDSKWQSATPGSVLFNPGTGAEKTVGGPDPGRKKRIDAYAKTILQTNAQRLGSKEITLAEAIQEATKAVDAEEAATPRSGLATPKVGEVRKGYQFKGGDPADKKSLERGAR